MLRTPWFLCLLVLFVLSSPVQAEPQTPSPDDTALHLRARPFVDAGFAPIEDVVEAHRDVRRVLIHDPYWILGTPGIEIERYGDGRAVLRLQYHGWRSQTQPLPVETWNALAKLEAAAFAPPPPPTPSLTAQTDAPPPPICHGWSAAFLSGDGRDGHWSQCYSPVDDGAHAYVVALVKAALATAPACPVDDETLFLSYQKCFGAGQTLDDPGLNAQYAALMPVFQDPQGSTLLNAARQAVTAPGIAVGNDVWRQARDAIARLKTYDDSQADALRRLRRLLYLASNASDADRTRIRNLIATVSDFQNGQQVNYAGVLTQLAWAGEQPVSARPDKSPG